VSVEVVSDLRGNSGLEVTVCGGGATDPTTARIIRGSSHRIRSNLTRSIIIKPGAIGFAAGVLIGVAVCSAARTDVAEGVVAVLRTQRTG